MQDTNIHDKNTESGRETMQDCYEGDDCVKINNDTMAETRMVLEPPRAIPRTTHRSAL
jgi:hypothetical protein